MSLTPRDIKHIVDALNESDWDSANIVVGDVSIAVSRGGALPLTEAPAVAEATGASAAMPVPEATSVAPAAAPAVAPIVADGLVVESPSVGVFWAASEPGAAPFVEVGTKVQPGDTLCIVEIMKLMNNVTAEIEGTVTAVHQENAAAVQFGSPLFTIAPGA